MERFEVIVVGAGLAGLCAAYWLAKEGIEVLVVERGDYSGAKNVSGGRIYLNPIREFLPEIGEDAPLERRVVKEVLTLMGESSATSIELRSERFNQVPYHSFTVLRARFDRWLCERAREKGAIVVTRNKVDDLIRSNGTVVGIAAGGDEIHSDVVIAADGAMSLTAEKAGLRGRQKPENLALGIKEIIELPARTIEERFNLGSGEGLARLLFGSLTKGIFGAGFLYTNLESISLGIVVRIRDLMEKGIEGHELLEGLKQRPEISRLIEGGEPVEYSAHVIPEGGIGAMPKLYSDGILIAGDAAGLALNMGITVRGMEFAIASGVLAAQAIKKAKESGDFSAGSLSTYEKLLKESFVLKDLKTFKNASRFLDNPRLFNLYPQTICNLLENLLFIDKKPKERLSTTVRKEINARLRYWLLRDFLGAFRI